MRTINYDETAEFTRDFKKLSKKYPSLKEDLETNKQYSIELYHCKEIDCNAIFKIDGVGNTADLRFYKIKKFQCRSLKGKGARSGIRIIYAYFPAEQKIIFLEIYFKTDQENEDRRRIKDFIKKSRNLI